ncbi:hypothetical protein ABW20_dc0104073 [Dactylellina cionopaga]|nr:hypothetical protein ABW20_dc0104073 [Dactylellina cionopaga]
MQLRDNLSVAVIAALTYASYKAYIAYDTNFSVTHFFRTQNQNVVYCTQPGRVYTSTEDEFSSKPDLATCFEVLESGLFGEIWATREDVPRSSLVKQIDGWVLPGFWDGHAHMILYGMAEAGVKAYNQEMPDIINSVLAYLQKHPTHGTRDQWIQGIGWDQAHFNGKMPTAEELASHPLLKDLYISLYRVDGHCIWVSPAVLRLLPSPVPPAPPGGEIPTNGVFCDNAMDWMIIPLIPPPTEQDIERYIMSAVSSLQKVGLVGVMEATTELVEVPVYKKLAETGELGMRIYGMVVCKVHNSFCVVDKVEIVNKDAAFILRAVKLFADGALGSWGAALIDPYDDKPTTGSMLLKDSELAKVTEQWYAADWQVCIHAIGDAANRAALDAFEAAEKLHPDMNIDRRMRLEHAQILHPSDQPRLRSLNIIPSIQPTHATSDMAYALSRLGDQRLRQSAYRMKSLFPTQDPPGDKNLPPVFGSDFPVEPPSPLHGMYAAVVRCNPAVSKEVCDGRDKLWEEEKVSRLQAIRGFGRNVAYGGWLEGFGVGKVVKGGWADWVVVSADVFDDSMDLRDVEVEETWVGGKRVFLKVDEEGERLKVQREQKPLA